MLGRCWAIVRHVESEATLVSRPVIAVDAGVEESCNWFGQCWSGVEPASYTMHGLRLWPTIEQKLGG